MKKIIYVLIVSLIALTSCKKDSTPTSLNIEPETVAYAGKVYHTVKINSQTWLKENLDIGTMIQGISNPSNDGRIEKYCYDNNTANCVTYGGLYKWNEAMAYSTTPGVQGVCPTGWHIPTKAEFETLKAAVNNDGNSLKAVGQGEVGGIGTNTSGFSALLAGNSDFYYLGDFASFWSSTVYDTTTANYMSLFAYGNNINFGNHNKDNGFSIRCLKD